MQRLCDKLGIPIRDWNLERLIEVKTRDGKIEVSGRDEMLNYYSLFKKVTIKYSKESKTCVSEPHLLPLKQEKCKLILEF